MPPIGNVSSFRAVNVPTPRPAAPPPGARKPSPLVAAVVAKAAQPSPMADRPHGSGTFSTPRAAPSRPAAAYTNPAPARSPLSHSVARPSAPNPPQQMSLAQRLALVSAAVTRDAANNPFAPIDRASPLMSAPIEQMMVRGQFNQDYQNLRSAGLLPKDARMPALSFVDQGAGKGGDLSYEVGSGGRGHVYLTPNVVQTAADRQVSGARWYGQEIPIHEMAHSFQAPGVQRNTVSREGGAQAYADTAVPAVVGPVPTNDTNYARYVQQVLRRGPDWLLRQQFQ